MGSIGQGCFLSFAQYFTAEAVGGRVAVKQAQRGSLLAALLAGPRAR
jgi:hypothetical protein